MLKHEVAQVGLALVGALALGCSGNNTGSVDLAVVDMVMRTDQAAGPDMTPPSDMMPLPPDMVPPTFNGCAEANYVDMTAAGAARAITFGGGVGFAYSPKCMLIAAGQSVSWTGTFSSHPLRPGVGGNATAGSPNNPITATDTGTTVSFTFPTAGYYPYRCNSHGGSGMNGAIKVQ